MSIHRKAKLTPEEYLSIERKAEHRSEYLDGEVFAMAVASRRHNRIVTNLVVALDNQLRERPCNVYSSDMRVKVKGAGLYTYPDVVVTCGEESFDDDHKDTLLNPIVIIEVLSDSIEAYDRGKKFEHYQHIETLSEYLLVSQDQMKIEQYIRQDNERWLYLSAQAPQGSVKLESIECELALEDIYSKTTLN